jgi:hypothetical protein
MGDLRNAYRIFFWKPEWKRPPGKLSIDWRKILECILRKYGGVMWTGFVWLKIRAGRGLL